MLIDWHTHVWTPDQLGDFGRQMDLTAAELAGESWSNIGTYEHHEAAMAKAGVEQFLVIGLTSRLLDLRIPNDYIADFVKRHPGRAVGVACVDPSDPDALAEVRRAREELGLVGLKLSPPYQGFHPHDPAAWKIYELANELEMVLLFHQGAVFHPKCSLECANVILLDRVASAFPDLRIVVCHCGQPWTNETVIVMNRHRNVWTDISARIVRRWQLYTSLMMAMDYGVTDKILWGSDFPAFQPDESKDLFLSLNERLPGMPPIPREVIEGILYDRPFSLLGLDAS